MAGQGRSTADGIQQQAFSIAFIFIWTGWFVRLVSSAVQSTLHFPFWLPLVLRKTFRYTTVQ